jgi:BASS family bile acid:Na+ symporter
LSGLFRSLLLWLVVGSAAAWFWPVERAGFDPFLTTQPVLWTLITITMFSLGTLVRFSELVPLRNKPWWVALGVAAQVIVMPLAAWLATKMIPLSDELAAGVILVGCVPGAMASNVLTHTAGGSVAYSVSLTTISTLLSPITVPLALSIFAVQADTSLLRPGQTALLLLATVVLPTIAGHLLVRRRERSQRWAEHVAPSLAAVCLLWIIAGVVASNRTKLASVQPVLITALLVVNVVGYLAGYLIARGFGLPSPFRRALTLEVGMQNAGLGTALAVSMYGAETTASIPTAAYTFGCMLTGTLLAVGWQRRGPAPCQADRGQD